MIEDACRAIDLNGSLDQSWERLTTAGVRRTSRTDYTKKRRKRGLLF